jgi:hypothetical protein
MKTRTILWVMALGVVGLIMTQNREFYMSNQALNIDFYYTRFHLPELPVAVLFFLVFIFGLSISSLSFYIDRLVIRRQMKKLSSALESCSKKSAQLEAAMAGDKRADKPRFSFFWRKKFPESNCQPGEMSERGLLDTERYQPIGGQGS